MLMLLDDLTGIFISINLIFPLNIVFVSSMSFCVFPKYCWLCLFLTCSIPWQLCSGMDENAVGTCAELIFAPIDASFADDAPLLPSGFRIIPLDSAKVKSWWRFLFHFSHLVMSSSDERRLIFFKLFWNCYTRKPQVQTALWISLLLLRLVHRQIDLLKILDLVTIWDRWWLLHFNSLLRAICKTMWQLWLDSMFGALFLQFRGWPWLSLLIWVLKLDFGHHLAILKLTL